MTLGERVRKMRQKRILSQPELSQLTGMTIGHLSMIETGKISLPRTRTIRTLASALDVSAEWLRFGRYSQLGKRK